MVRLVPTLCLLGLLFGRLEKTFAPLRIQHCSVANKIYTITLVLLSAVLTWIISKKFCSAVIMAQHASCDSKKKKKNTNMGMIAIAWFMDSAAMQHLHIMFPALQAYIQLPSSFHLKINRNSCKGTKEKFSSCDVLEQIVWLRIFKAKWEIQYYKFHIWVPRCIHFNSYYPPHIMLGILRISITANS